MKKSVYKYFYLIFLFTLLLLLDRFTKSMAVSYLKDGEPFVIIKNVFEFHYLSGGNSGAAWGILKGHTAFFIIITLIVMILIGLLIIRLNKIILTAHKSERGKSYVYIRKYTSLQLIFVMLEAGAAGNLIDRVTEGSVVDFIYFKLIDFPIFNIADCYVTISVALLIIFSVFFLKEKEFDMIFHIKPGKNYDALFFDDIKENNAEKKDINL